MATNKINTRQCLVVLGMHRSGTSVTTGLLHFLGAHPGNDLLPPNKRNPKGFFESKKVNELNNEIFSSLGRSWDDIHLLPENWIKHSKTQSIKKKITELLNSEFNTVFPVIKDPRLCQLLPLWLEIFEELKITPKFIIVARNPDAVTKSIHLMKGFSTMKSLILYMNYLVFLESTTRDYARTFINYPEVLSDWQNTIEIIEKDLELSFSKRVIEVETQVSSFLSNELDHFQKKESKQDDFIDLRNYAHKLYQQFSHQNGPDHQILDSLKKSYLSYYQNVIAFAEHISKIERELVFPERYAEYYYGLNAKSVLYWSVTSDGYINKGDHVFSQYQFNDQPQVLYFKIPAGVEFITGLRLDLTDRPAYVELRNIKLLDDKNELQWCWDGSESLFGFNSADSQMVPCLNKEGKAGFIATGNDPYFEMELPEKYLVLLCQKWTLVIEVLIQRTQDTLPELLSDFYRMKKTVDIINETFDHS